MTLEHPHNKILAFVYLGRENDEKNKCTISSFELTVTHKGKSKEFRLADLRKITFSEKFLLLPIVTGGVMGPFFFIALIGDYFPPAASLTGFLVSVFLLYLGFSGKQTMRVEMLNDTYEIFLNRVTDNLRSFAEFSNNIILNTSKDDHSFLFFIPITSQEKEKLIKTGKWKLNESGVFGLAYRDFNKTIKTDQGSDLHTYIKVDVRKENLEVKYEKDESGLLKPKLYGEISGYDRQKNSYS